MIALLMTTLRASLGGLSSMAERLLECLRTLNSHKIMGDFMI